MSTTILTYGIIKKRLQIAQSFAVKYGVDIIDLEKKGIICEDKKENAKLMLDLIYAIKPYACTTPGVDAMLTYNATSWVGGSATFTLQLFLNFSYGGVSSRVVFGQSTVDGALTAMAAAWNALGHGTIAFYDPSTNIFILLAPAGSGTTGNTYQVSWAAGGGGAPLIPQPSGNFSGGTNGNSNIEFDDTDTCLDTNQLWSVLNKLCNLQNKPCNTYLNFEN